MTNTLTPKRKLTFVRFVYHRLRLNIGVSKTDNNLVKSLAIPHAPLRAMNVFSTRDREVFAEIISNAIGQKATWNNSYLPSHVSASGHGHFKSLEFENPQPSEDLQALLGIANDALEAQIVATGKSTTRIPRGTRPYQEQIRKAYNPAFVKVASQNYRVRGSREFHQHIEWSSDERNQKMKDGVRIVLDIRNAHPSFHVRHFMTTNWFKRDITSFEQKEIKRFSLEADKASYLLSVAQQMPEEKQNQFKTDFVKWALQEKEFCNERDFVKYLLNSIVNVSDFKSDVPFWRTSLKPIFEEAFINPLFVYFMNDLRGKQHKQYDFACREEKKIIDSISKKLRKDFPDIALLREHDGLSIGPMNNLKALWEVGDKAKAIVVGLSQLQPGLFFSLKTYGTGNNITHKSIDLLNEK